VRGSRPLAGRYLSISAIHGSCLLDLFLRNRRLRVSRRGMIVQHRLGFLDRLGGFRLASTLRGSGDGSLRGRGRVVARGEQPAGAGRDETGRAKNREADPGSNHENAPQTQPD
jgi:hypothetical protein